MIKNTSLLRDGVKQTTIGSNTLYKIFLLLITSSICFTSFINKSIYSSIVATLELNKTVNLPSPITGEIFTYTLQYSCASLVDNCEGTVITDPLPPEVEYVGLTGSPHTINEVYNSGTHTVTFTFQNILTAGSTGQVQIDVRFPNGTTPNGTLASNTASISASNAATINASINVTASATVNLDFEKEFSSGGAINGQTTYQIRTCNAGGISNAIGHLGINNLTITDTLPAGTIFVDAHVGNGASISYDAASHSVTLTHTYLAPGDCIWPRITVQYNDPPFSVGSNISNVANYFYTPVGESPTVFRDTLTHTITNPNPYAESSKGSSSSFYNQGAGGSYYFNASISGTEPVADFCINDTIPTGLEITGFNMGGWYYGGVQELEDRIDVYYTTNLNGPTLVPGSPFSIWNPNFFIDPVGNLGLVKGGGEYITVLNYCFGTVPSGFDSYFDIQIGFDVMNNAPLGIATNCAELSTSDSGFTFDEGCVDVTISESISGVVSNPRKHFDNPNDFYRIGDTISMYLTIRNDGISGDSLVNPIMLDFLPPELSYVPGSWVLFWAIPSGTVPTPNFTEIPNYKGTGRTMLQWDWTGAAAYTFAPDEEGQVRVDFVVTDFAVGGPASFYNSVTVLGDNITTCYGHEVVDLYDFDNDSNVTEMLCNDSARVHINPLIALESEKLVKGQLDSAYTKFPVVASSVPGGIADYILEIRNLGNVPMDSITIIDILPSVGDVGVINPLGRDSRWRPNLVSTVSAPPGVTVFYSIAANPCRDTEGFVPSGPVGCTTPSWTTSAPTDLTTVQSLKFDFGTTQLLPQDTFRLAWPMRVPVNVFTTIGAPPDSIAWNSFGFIGRRTDNGQYTLPSEPVKVGIDVEDVMTNVFGDVVWEDTDQDGIQDAGEPGINGVRIELYKDNGDGLVIPTTDSLISFTLTANGGYYLFPNLDDGDYYAVFYKPPGMDITLNDIGGDNDLDSDGIANSLNGFDVAITPIVTLDNLAFDLSWDLGLYNSSNGFVGNYVWHDINGNGIQDESNLTGINGVQIYLFDNASSSAPIDSFTSGNDPNGNPGFFLFSEIVPGNYFLELDLPSGVSYTTEGASGTSDPADSDFNSVTNRTEIFAVTAGSYDNSWDAGLILSGTEICDNGVDDDLDELIDSLDPDCCAAQAPVLSK